LKTVFKALIQLYFAAVTKANCFQLLDLCKPCMFHFLCATLYMCFMCQDIVVKKLTDVMCVCWSHSWYAVYMVVCKVLVQNLEELHTY